MVPDVIWCAQQVALGDLSYPYHFGCDCVDRIAWSLGQYGADNYLVVTDDTVLSLHGEKLLPELARYGGVEVLRRPAGEEMKSLAHLEDHLEQAIAAGASRRSVVVTFGGGVPGNLGGMVAAMLFRGVRLVHVPTTTIAAMDSVISLKQAINSRQGKNHIGAYHLPQAVYTDVRLLETLPERELRSGLCEAAKNCLTIRPESIPALRGVLARGDLGSPSSLLWLLEESLAAKMAVMAEDSRERQAGLILEYGHTVGHAVELCDRWLRCSDGLSHGEAVAIGMLAAARISAALGNLTEESVQAHDELVAALDVPARIPDDLSVSEVIDVVRNDHKRGYLELSSDEVAMVLLRDLGEPVGPPDLPLVPVDLAVVHDAVVSLAERSRAPVEVL